MRHILKCSRCGSYTLKELCGCGSKTNSAKPLKYSPDDKFSAYRRKAKSAEYNLRGLI